MNKSGLGVLLLLAAAAAAAAASRKKSVRDDQGASLEGDFLLSAPEGSVTFRQGAASMASISAGGLSVEKLNVAFEGQVANTGTQPIALRWILQLKIGAAPLRAFDSDRQVFAVNEARQINPWAQAAAADPAGDLYGEIRLFNDDTGQLITTKTSNKLAAINAVLDGELSATGSYAFVVDQDQWYAKGAFKNTGNVTITGLTLFANLLAADGSLSSGGVAPLASVTIAPGEVRSFTATLVRPGHWSGQIPAGEMKIRLKINMAGLQKQLDVGTGYVSQPQLAASLVGDFVVG